MRAHGNETRLGVCISKTLPRKLEGSHPTIETILKFSEGHLHMNDLVGRTQLTDDYPSWPDAVLGEHDAKTSWIEVSNLYFTPTICC